MQKTRVRKSGRWALAVAIIATIALGATAAVALQGQAPTEIVVSFGDSTIELSQVTTATAVCNPEGSNPAVTWWSSDPEVASVDNATGLVTPHKFGQAVISAKSTSPGDPNIVNGNATISVVPTKATGVTVSWADTNSAAARDMETGTQAVAQVVSVSPSDATTKTASWSSSDSEVATVAADGTVSAISSGVATITATADDGSGAKGKLVIKVWKRVYAESVSVSAASTSINIGYETTVTAAITPLNTTDKSVSWESSDTAIATVDEFGNVRGIAEGTVRIIATSNDASVGDTPATGYVEITVRRVLADSVAINLDVEALRVGAETTASATALPAETTDKTVTWSSSDERIATVDPVSGVVHGVSAGRVRIIASSNDAGMAVSFAYLEVTALSVPDSVDVTLDPDTVRVGQGSKATANVLPLDSFSREVTWSSSDENIATVDEDGNITTYSSGECTITATTVEPYFRLGGFAPLMRTSITGSAKLTVAPALATKIVVTVQQNVLEVGQTTQASAAIMPESAATEVTWSSSDAAVATVGSTGVVTAVKAGVVNIVATAKDGSGIYDAEQITVNAVPVVPVVAKDVLTKPVLSTSSVKHGKKFYIKSTITPAYALKTAPAVAVIQKKGTNGKYRTVSTVKLYVTAKTSTASTIGRYALIKTKGAYRVRVENTASVAVLTAWKSFTVK